MDADAPALVAALDDDARLGLGAREVELVELASQPDDLLDRVRAVLELVARAADGGGVGLELDEGDAVGWRSVLDDEHQRIGGAELQVAGGEVAIVDLLVHGLELVEVVHDGVAGIPPG
jgi:hypothetical protein